MQRIGVIDHADFLTKGAGLSCCALPPSVYELRPRSGNHRRSRTHCEYTRTERVHTALTRQTTCDRSARHDYLLPEPGHLLQAAFDAGWRAWENDAYYRCCFCCEKGALITHVEKNTAQPSTCLLASQNADHLFRGTREMVRQGLRHGREIKGVR